MSYVSRGKIRLFSRQHLFDVLRLSQLKVYQLGLTSKKDVVLVPFEGYMTRAELAMAVHVCLEVQVALERRQVTIEKIGKTRNSEMRMAYAKWARENGVKLEGEPDEIDSV